MFEKYYDENGNVGVLISPGFGAGWSTWSHKYGNCLAMDRRIIEEWLTSPTRDEMDEFLESIGYEDTFTGGYGDLELVFLEPGTRFYIDEYDGHESIVTDDRFYTA